MLTVPLTLAIDGSVATISLNRPEVMNAMNTQMFVELRAALHDLAYDDGLRVLVVTGAGERAFSTGGDLKQRDGMTDHQWRRQHQLAEEVLLAVVGLDIVVRDGDAGLQGLRIDQGIGDAAHAAPRAQTGTDLVEVTARGCLGQHEIDPCCEASAQACLQTLVDRGRQGTRPFDERGHDWRGFFVGKPCSST